MLFVLLQVMKNWKYSCRSSVISMRSYPPQYPRSSTPLNPSPPSFFSILFFLRRAPQKKSRSARFLETAHRAVLINSLITGVNSGPTILRSYFLHWIIILFHCLFFLFEVRFWKPNTITYCSQGWSLVHRPSTFLFLLNNLLSVLFLGESKPQNGEAW